jgi:arylsulfatase A-like enzyme
MVTSTATLTPSPTPTNTPTTPRLNFLVINLDDTRPDGMDRMAVVQSRLAPESLTFQNSFVPYSSCCPSRASLLSGLYAVHHGTRQVTPPLGGAGTFRISGADHETLAVWLHDAGYATGLFGKYLNDYAPESNQGPSGGYYIPPGWTRWRAFVSEHYGGMDGPSYELVDENGIRTPYDDHTTDAQYSTDVTAAAVRQFIGDSAAAGQPFFALWEPYASHGDTPTLLPIPAAQDLNTLTDLPLFRPPNYAEPDRSDKPRWAEASTINRLLEALTDLERERAYESLLSVDREIALMLDQLESLGLADHTVVVLTSDNGVSWGEHAQFTQAKSSAYEENLRVQFMIHAPGGAVGTSTSPVLNIDIAPTIADLAGVPVPVSVDGQSIRPVVEGASGWVRNDFLLEQWRQVRNASITYSGQPMDGDRLQLFYGPEFPKAVATFEFDSGDGVEPGSIAVPIEGTADATYYALGAAVVTAVPNSLFSRNVTAKQLNIVDTSAALSGFYWWDEVNQAGSFAVAYPIPDFFGVRDVRDGYMYVHYEDGEAELYDMNVDPWQLNNAANDPAYTGVRAELDARMRMLAGLP